MDGGLEIRLLAELLILAAIVFGFAGVYRRVAGLARNAVAPVRIGRREWAAARVCGGRGNIGDDGKRRERASLTIQLNTKTLPCSCTGYTL